MTQTGLFVTRDIVPYHTGNGSAVLSHALITMLTRCGVDLTTVAFQSNSRLPVPKSAAEDRIELHTEPVRSRFQKVKGVIWPTDRDYFVPNELLKQTFVRLNRPQYVFSYGWEALNVHSLVPPETKRVAFLVDLVERGITLRNTYGKRHGRQRPDLSLISSLRWRRKPSACYRLLRSASIIVEHASQHAEELKEMGFHNVHYIPHPLPRREQLTRKRTTEKW